MDKITLEKRFELFKKELYNQELSSIIAKRHNKNYDFLLIQDTKEEIEKTMEIVRKKHPGIDENFKDFLNTNNFSYYPFFSWYFNDNYGYSDEYAQCDDCFEIFKMPPCDYNYYKEGVLLHTNLEDKWVCDKCLKEYYIEEYINYHINNPKRCIYMLTYDDMLENNWIDYKNIEYESGLYSYASADPVIIYETAKDEFPEYDFIFVRTDENPFAINYRLMMKKREVE